MLLNYEQIKSENLLQNFDKNNFKNAAYDLRIDKMIDKNEGINDEIVLAPQGMATIIFKEVVKLPSHILSFAHVKTSLARIGIMAINIGIIDPCYNGLLSTVIINYGNKPYKIDKNTICLRLTFHRIDKLEQSIDMNNPPNKNFYFQQRELEVQKYLGDTFLNLKKVSEDIYNKVWELILRRFGLLSVIIAAIAFVVNLFFNILTRSDKQNDVLIKSYESQTKTIQEKYNQLEIKFENLEQKLNSKDTSRTH